MRDSESERQRHRRLLPDSRGQVRGPGRHVSARTGHAQSRNAVEKAAADLAGELDARRGGRGTEQKDGVNAVAREMAAQFVRLFDWQVERQHAVDARVGGARGELGKSHPRQGIGVREEDQRHVQVRPDIGDQREDARECGTACQRPLRRSLNDRTVRKRVRKRHAHLDHVRAAGGQRQQDLAGPRHRRIAGGDVCDEAGAPVGAEPVECLRDA